MTLPHVFLQRTQLSGDLTCQLPHSNLLWWFQAASLQGWSLPASDEQSWPRPNPATPEQTETWTCTWLKNTFTVLLLHLMHQASERVSYPVDNKVYLLKYYAVLMHLHAHCTCLFIFYVWLQNNVIIIKYFDFQYRILLTVFLHCGNDTFI